MHEIEWTSGARRDVRSIIDYLGEFEAAGKFEDRSERILEYMDYIRTVRQALSC